LSFVLPASLVGSPFCAAGRCALEHLRSSGCCRSTPGAFAPDRVVLSRSILTCGPIRPTRRHIPISPLRGLYEMPSLCTLRLDDLRVVPRFRCPFLPNMPPSTTPGRSETGWFQSCGPDIGLRHVMSGSALPTVLLSASRRADFSELHWFAFAAACQVARPLCRSDQNSSGHRDFYFQAFDESVTLLAAGYNYDSYWTVLPLGLSPMGMTTSVAAP
jgi:hypothetical protein